MTRTPTRYSYPHLNTPSTSDPRTSHLSVTCHRLSRVICTLLASPFMDALTHGFFIWCAPFFPPHALAFIQGTILSRWAPSPSSSVLRSGRRLTVTTAARPCSTPPSSAPSAAPSSAHSAAAGVGCTPSLSRALVSSACLAASTPRGPAASGASGPRKRCWSSPQTS